jgi:hypothetical protein
VAVLKTVGLKSLTVGTRLRTFNPERFELKPLPPGHATGDVHVTPDEAARLARAAAVLAAGLGAGGARGGTVMWQREGNQLLLLPTELSLTLGRGLLAFSIPVSCDQSGAAPVHVSFVVGDPDSPAGFLAVTEERPRGPEIVVDTWGEALVAFAWSVVLQLATSLAAEAGMDEDGAPLIPAAIAANPDGLWVTPMARHAFDRASR